MDTALAFKEFLQYTLTQLLSQPESATIQHDESSNHHHFVVYVVQDDMGKIIGRNGFTISSIRSLLEAAATKHGVRVTLKVEEA